MKTIAIRFSDNFAPKEGTIAAHESLIKSNGYVWYGKMGSHRMSPHVIEEVMKNGEATILLIHTQSRIHYLAKVKEIKEKCPEPSLIPSYYRDRLSDFANWFKIVSFEPVGEETLKEFYTSGGNTIFDIYKKSMGSYFVVERRG